jgi:type IV pilus assembly protein PilA
MKSAKLQQGFSWLGWIILISVIGILVSIAVPSYCDYLPRTRLSEGLVLAASAKTAVAENAANGVPFANGWTPPDATSNVSSIAINPANGIITITYTNKIAMSHIIFWLPVTNKGILYNPDGTLSLTDREKDAIMSDTPTLLLLPISGNKFPVLGEPPITGKITWECHSASAPPNDVMQNLLGTLDPKYAPSDCRR